MPATTPEHLLIACRDRRVWDRSTAHPDPEPRSRLEHLITLLPDLHDRLRCYAALRIV